MRILLDECVNRKLRRELTGHDVRTVPEEGWSGIKNGALLTLAEPLFDVLLTVDRNIPFQQKMQGRQIALVILIATNSRLESLLPVVPELLALLPTVQSGRVYTVAKQENTESSF